MLEIGCGVGAVARELAGRHERVLAIDLSPEMIRRAREHTRAANLELRVEDFLEWRTEERFDAIVSIATLHHLPFERALEKMKHHLAPRGVLAIADLFDASALRELPYNVLSLLARNPFPRPTLAARRAWAEHEVHDHHLELRDIRRRAARILRGARIERLLGWRYTLTWSDRGS